MLIGACGDTECVGDCRECGMIILWDEEEEQKIPFMEALGVWG